MNNNETFTSCGAIQVLNKLRQSQEDQPLAEAEHNESSRLMQYIEKNKKSKRFSNSKELQEVDRTEIIEIDPYLIHRWSGKDRPENELGDLEDLAKSFKQVGQQVPCIVRPHSEIKGEYELIVGECRWRASKIAKVKLKVIVNELDDRMATFIQAIENEKRNDISEYAKGMSYAKKIDEGIISQKDLIEILGISKQQVSRLLSFRKIPFELSSAIEDFRKVSARTAEELSRLSSKSDQHLKALISLAPRIRTGKFGGNRIIKEIEKSINLNKKELSESRKVIAKDGRHIFTWRLDNNASPSIHFPKDIANLFKEEKINFKEITEEIKECISKKVIELTN